MNPPVFRGIYTVTYRVPDLAEGKARYSRAFGVEPYFDESPLPDGEPVILG